MCDRWDALARHLTHLDDDDTTHRQADHQRWHVDCRDYQPAPGLARDPRDDPRTTQEDQ